MPPAPIRFPRTLADRSATTAYVRARRSQPCRSTPRGIATAEGFTRFADCPPPASPTPQFVPLRRDRQRAPRRGPRSDRRPPEVYASLLPAASRCSFASLMTASSTAWTARSSSSIRTPFSSMARLSRRLHADPTRRSTHSSLDTTSPSTQRGVLLSLRDGRLRRSRAARGPRRLHRDEPQDCPACDRGISTRRGRTGASTSSGRSPAPSAQPSCS